ncbi:pilus assembly protein [Pseudomonas paeninsulae]|uniref:pilus assembly protein n=1 Tax=Pseudomonas paeninsulae TaxID=3110772 RepID=UPI002D79A5AB|nr:PilC/PilY family type IV pilus protein [Pseudomonas sp. IT1137]
MNIWLRFIKLMAILMALNFPLGMAKAEDIDIFIGGEANSALPNIVFILDNTANWSRASQKWPGGLTQGESEARAIKTALAGMVDNTTSVAKFNVGMLEFTTSGNAGEDGGFVRFDLQALTPNGYKALSEELDEILAPGGVNDNKEKRSANTAYGNLMYDFYNYLGGFSQSYAGGGTESTKADPGGYSSLYSRFATPIADDNLCSNTYLIFIGNPNSSGPADDSSTNSDALKALYTALGDSPEKLAGLSGGAPLPLPQFTTTTTTTPATQLGYSAQCYKNNEVNNCTTAENATGLCVGKSNCSCSTATPQACTKSTSKFVVSQAGETTTTVAPVVGSFDTTSGAAWNLDDWSKFLHNYGVPFTVTDAFSGNSVIQRVKVTSYLIDVFNAHQDASQTKLFLSAADVGGGKYFAAKNENAIVDGINSALSDILSVSATFSAATLPLSATNRSQSANEVYIGMFRPYKAPRWFGNLKRYKIGLINGAAELVDSSGESAVNNLSGFLTECAKSYWTLDKGNYWESLNLSPPPLSQCTTASILQKWSDSPDGPFVEKGGAAQVSRYSVIANRKVLTVSGSSLAAVTAANLGNNTTLLNYLKGSTPGAGETMSSSTGRPSIHGDVIHSRPLPINYGGSTGTVLFYGVNDGLFRAVKGADGSELWSLLAPEHFAKIQRLYDDSPLIAFPNASATETPTPTPKDYFFDGAVGQITNYDANNAVTSAYIYPTMRRGGRMVYALNVTDPNAPSLLWKRGCPNQGNTTGCDSGFSGIGQTWSTPQGAYLGGYVDATSGASKPVLIFGGGYDTCLDPDSRTFACSSANGKGVYVLDATDATILGTLPILATDYPVVGDVALADVNSDGKTDFAYAADAAGNLYRVNFANMASDGTLTALAKNAWSITKIASTQGANRRFLNSPAVAVYKNSVYVSLGSGNRERQLKSNYPYQTQVEDRFYVFLDNPSSSSGAVDLDGSSMNNSVAGSNCGAAGIYPNSTKRGWYYDLAGRGEQVINPAVIGAGKVFFNSYQPDGTSAGVCAGPKGIATGYSASLFTGACEMTTTTLVGPPPIPPTIPPAICIANCDTTNPIIVTVCIGCKPGLAPVLVEPKVDQSRQKIYWKTDIDR